MGQRAAARFERLEVRVSAQRGTDVDHALVLDRDEVGPDSHRHRLDVREHLVGDLLGAVPDPNFDPDLVDRTSVQPGLPQLSQLIGLGLRPRSGASST